MYFENEIYISKRERPSSPYVDKEKEWEKDIFNIKYPPINQKELKSIILSILNDKKLILPISSKDIMDRIKYNFKDQNKIIIILDNLNFEEIFDDLYKKKAILSKKLSFGIDVFDVILKIYKEKIFFMCREFSSDMPNKMPELENNFDDNIFIKNEVNNTILTDILNKPPAIRTEFIKKYTTAQFDNEEITEKFTSTDNTLWMCEFGTREKCFNGSDKKCEKIHYKKIILLHTEESLGNCSYLNSCRQMQFCKYLHYKIDERDIDKKKMIDTNNKNNELNKLPMQWINCDLRQFDFNILGKFGVIMLDPPWDIHMNLPYGLLKDKEMKYMQVGKLIDEGACFLWVTGRAMELGRECLENWGFKKVEEIVWIKTNQLQSIIRTGRTGHWLNHSKEHCLVGIKGNPDINRSIDCDVLVSKVRETSRKPDEIYDLIERFHPAGRKIELFARPHNRRPGWVSLGNQLPGMYIVEDEIIKNYEEKTGKKLDIEEMEKNKNQYVEDQRDKFIEDVYSNHLNKNK